MNRFKKSSGSKYSWKPAHSPSTITQKPATPTPAATKKSAPAPLKKEKPAPPIFPKTLNTYLGPRGYTVPKS